MKIICAGISKTGTKSLSAALKELGYAVIYDFMEHFWEHGDYWKNIFEHGSTEKDFKEMYKNVDVVMDVPVCSFWEEVCEAFPEAKVCSAEANKTYALSFQPMVYRKMEKKVFYYRLACHWISKNK